MDDNIIRTPGGDVYINGELAGDDSTYQNYVGDFPPAAPRPFEIPNPPIFAGPYIIDFTNPLSSHHKSRPVDYDRIHQLEEFCQFVADSIFSLDEDADEPMTIGFFMEVVCRKLYRLGFIDTKEENGEQYWTEKKDKNNE